MENVETSIATAPHIDYSAAYELADEVRAFAIIESGEDPHKVGDDGCAYGLLQMHPATFKRIYGSMMRFAPSISDTWSTAQIKACAAYLASHAWRSASQDERDAIVQAWNLGERAVFIEKRRNPEYLARWLAAYDGIKKAAA
jgi:hypothetical protein